ncbi:MAG: hypothetical protein M3275_01515 [Thermoproteota archaeon]|nr:hypothetical protein [Thermoproteota archaeon]
MDKLHKFTAVSALVFNSALLIGALFFFHDVANAQEKEIITFRLQGTHAEDTVSETAEALGWNVTVFEPIANGIITVDVTRLSQ